MNSNLIFEFSPDKTDGDSSLVDLLGGKGANLAEMSKMGIQVPPGFTITTEACNSFIKNKKLPEGLVEDVKESILKLENLSGKNFGGQGSPLLLSVRSGGKISMPGMMDSILNIGRHPHFQRSDVAELQLHDGQSQYLLLDQGFHL